MHASLFLALLSVGCDWKKDPKERDSGSEDSAGDDTVHTGSGDTEDREKETGETAETGRETGDTEESGETGETSETEPESYSMDDIAYLTVYSLAEGAAIGNVFSVGDVNGDGLGDLAFDSRDGAAYGFSTPLLKGIHEEVEADFILQKPVIDCCYFTPDLVGDVNGDGVDDLQWGGYIHFGPIEGLVSEESAEVRLVHTEGYLASSHDRRGDNNDDGRDDLIIDWYTYGDYDDMFRTYVTTENIGIYDSIEEGDISLDEPTARIVVETVDMEIYPFSMPFGFAGDTNGDGFSEVIYAYNWSRFSKLILGPVYGEIDGAADQDAYLDGLVQTLGDVNGDGYGDLGTTTSYELKVYFGPVSGDTFYGDIEIEPDRDLYLATGLNAIGDLNVDGRDDFLMATVSRSWEGVVLLFETPVGEGIITTDAATARFLRPGLGQVEMDGPLEVDGDGIPDLLIGDEWSSATASHAGIGWVILGGSLP